MEDLETLTRTVNGLTFRVRIVPDYDPDLSWLGEYTSKPTVPYWDRSISALVVRDGDNGWVTVRDARGRLSRVDASRDAYDTRTMRYISGFQCPESASACIADANRLEAYNAGDWSCFGIIAELVLNDETVAEGSCFGFESDMSDGDRDAAIADVIHGIDERKELAAYAERSATGAALARGLLASLKP